MIQSKLQLLTVAILSILGCKRAILTFCMIMIVIHNIYTYLSFLKIYNFLNNHFLRGLYSGAETVRSIRSISGTPFCANSAWKEVLISPVSIHTVQQTDTKWSHDFNLLVSFHM
jgi:hypothetical protein